MKNCVIDWVELIARKAPRNAVDGNKIVKRGKKIWREKQMGETLFHWRTLLTAVSRPDPIEF